MSQKDMPSGARRFGYFVTILVNFGLIYVANHLLDWNVPFLTEDFTNCLWAITLSLGVTIFVNFIFMVFDRRWFRSLMEAMNSVFSFISGYVFLESVPPGYSGTFRPLGKPGIDYSASYYSVVPFSPNC